MVNWKSTKTTRQPTDPNGGNNSIWKKWNDKFLQNSRFWFVLIFEIEITLDSFIESNSKIMVKTFFGFNNCSYTQEKTRKQASEPIERDEFDTDTMIG